MEGVVGRGGLSIFGIDVLVSKRLDIRLDKMAGEGNLLSELRI